MSNSKKLKIGMVLDSEYPPDPRVRSEALTLVEAGHEVSLFCIDHQNRAGRENLEGIEIFRYTFNQKYYKKIYALAYTIPLYHWLLWKPLLEYFKSNEFDVIHIHDMIIAGIALPLAKKLGLRVTLDLHEDRPAIMTLYTHVNSGIGRFLISINKWRRVQCELVSKADNVVVVTSEARRDLSQGCSCRENKISWVPNTLNLKNFRGYQKDQTIIDHFKDKYVILYLGNTGIRRGTDTALEAVKILQGDLPDLLLVLVGSSRDDNYLKELAKKLGVDEIVEFCGWQDERLFPSYLAGADVCLSPLKKNRHHDTTYANKLFQYMSEAKPVIVSDCLAQANVVRETGCGLVHEPGNAQSLAEKIREMHNTPQQAQEMGLRGRKAVEDRYNWEINKQQLLEIYE